MVDQSILHLRVREDINLSDEELKTRFRDFLPHKRVEIERFSNQPDCAQSFEQRKASLQDALLFLFDADTPTVGYKRPDAAQDEDTVDQPADRKRFARQLNALNNYCHFDKDSVVKSNAALKEHVTDLIRLIQLYWDCSYDEAIQRLNKAEQYLLISKGRPDLITLIPMPRAVVKASEPECLMQSSGSLAQIQPTAAAKDSEPEYLMQWDKPLPPRYDLLEQEFLSLKKADCPRTPAWLRELNKDWLTCLCNLELEPVTIDKVVLHLTQLADTWLHIQKDAINLQGDLLSIKEKEDLIPAWYGRLDKSSQLFITSCIVAGKDIGTELTAFIDKLTKIKNTSNDVDILQFINILPEWYWVLPSIEQPLLAHLLKNAHSVKEVLLFFPSRLHTIPGPANLREHSPWKMDAQGKIVPIHPVNSDEEAAALLTINAQGEPEPSHPGKRYGSAHVASRESLDDSLSVQFRMVSSNYEKILSYAEPGQPSLTQTLISPMYLKLLKTIYDWIPWLPRFSLPPDYDLNEQLKQARRNAPAKSLHTNHPINPARVVMYTPQMKPSGNFVIDLVRSFIEYPNKDGHSLKALAEQFMRDNPDHPYSDELAILLPLYVKLHNSGPGSASYCDYPGRELCLSSVEQLITMYIKGFPYGSCQSGKDRKGLEFIHTDAMIVYRNLYGTWPEFHFRKLEPRSKEAKERENFVRIFAEIYWSRQHQVHSAQNAPGSAGIKTPNNYLPADIVAYINQQPVGKDGTLYTDADEMKADKNEVKAAALSESEAKLADFFACQLVARELGEDECTKLFTSLVRLAGEKDYVFSGVKFLRALLQPLVKPILPESFHTGLEQLEKIMHRANPDNNVENMTNILYLATCRSNRTNERSDAANEMFSSLKALSDHKSVLSTQERAAKAIANWTSMYEDFLRRNNNKSSSSRRASSELSDHEPGNSAQQCAMGSNSDLSEHSFFSSPNRRIVSTGSNPDKTIQCS